jgi:2'-5' RNA ligase
MQKRLYITIDLPDEIKETFRKEEKRWRNLNVFWTGFSHYRLMLEYLGLVDQQGLRMVRDALDNLSRDTAPFEVRLDRIVLGPDAKDPKMFWATIFEDGAVKKFRKELKERLEAAGFKYPEKDFIPHIVLATAKGNQLKGKQTNVHLRGKISVDHVNLYSSQTYTKGMVKYKLMDSYSLDK